MIVLKLNVLDAAANDLSEFGVAPKDITQDEGIFGEMTVENVLVLLIGSLRPVSCHDH